MRTLAIGDIHGCHTALVTLLRQAVPQPDDQVVFLGDYIDRGRDSRAVLDCLLQQRSTCRPVFLRGNHEVMILDARMDSAKERLWQDYGGFETLCSYEAERRDDWPAAIPKPHWGFLERTVPYLEIPRQIFVHACIDPDLDMGEQPEWLLYWEFFDRMRPHKSGKKVICGHTPQQSGQINDVEYAACIDTGAVGGGWLTCLEVDSGRYWQANEKGERRSGMVAGISSA